MTGATVTEIEIYDTTQPADPVTGLSPIRARVRQRHDASGTVQTVEQSESKAKEETKAEASAEGSLTYNGGELAELVVKAEKPPSLWDRIKQGAGWATAIILLVAVGWLIYKLKKR